MPECPRAPRASARAAPPHSHQPGSSNLLRTLDSARQRATAWRLLAGGMVFIALGLFATTVDANWTTALGGLLPPDSIIRRVVKQAYRLYSSWTIGLLAIVIVWRTRRWEPLAGLAIAMAACMAVVHLLKVFVGRARPQLDLGAYAFAPLALADKHDAFPSGHTASAVALAAIVGICWPATRWLLFPGALLVAWARLAQERHFLSDTLVGAGIALITVHACALLLGPRFFHGLGRSPQSRTTLEQVQ